MDNHLPTLYQSFIHKSRYSRWLPEKKRRENFGETVTRFLNFFTEHLEENNGYKLKQGDRDILENAILDMRVMPSMRALMTAGPALKRDHIAGYNCSFVAMNRVQAFDEILYILMCGTGVGFSVERQDIAQLPVVAEEFHATDTTIVVPDSRIGWAKSLRELIGLLYQGQIPKWDLSRLRPAGAPLKTFGGRSSGPDPLDQMFRFLVSKFQEAAGRRLSSIEVHDVVCAIADCVIVGGVRRSALISLSNLSDDRMRHAKSGQWWETEGQRALANNSAAYTEKPDIGIFIDEWKALYDSKSGERGIFNRAGAKRKIESLGRRDSSYDFGVNPCGEILLRDREFCNLSEVIVRADDNIETLKEKVRIATILGTFQSTLTNFRYISKKWTENCEEERLLGVSLTGIMDNVLTSTPGEKLESLLDKLRQVAVDTNKEWAKKLGINQSAAVTCIKPSGTVSQLTDSASGIHTRHSEYYIRTVRSDKKDPLAKVMVENGFPHEDDVTKPNDIFVFSFPVHAPKNSVKRNDLSAIQQLEIWQIYQRHWCEHNPSITVTVREHEWLEVGAWVYKNFDEMCGVSFLPHTDHVYRQAPYQECDEATYNELKSKMPNDVDWSLLSKYEEQDETAGSQELACVAGACEI